MPSNDDNQGMKVWWICLRAPLNPQTGFMAHGGWKTLLNGRSNGPGQKTSNGSWWRHGRVLSSPCWSYLAGIFIGDCKRRRPRGRLTRIANNNWEHCKYCNKYTTFSPSDCTSCRIFSNGAPRSSLDFPKCFPKSCGNFWCVHN